MNLKPDILAQITQYAELAFGPEEISIILELDKGAVLCDLDEEGSFYKAYQKGKLLAQAKLRKSEYDLAVRGHTDAQKRFNSYLND